MPTDTWFTRLRRWLTGSSRSESSSPSGDAKAPATPRALAVRGREGVREGRSHYIEPNDERGIHRLDFQHFLLREAFGANYLAPLTQPRAILDVGCGTGRWAMEMAQTFPQADVAGMDMDRPSKEYEAEHSERPANYRFVLGNALDPLPFSDGAFDFVHMRFLSLGIPENRWPDVVRELVRVTAPGGFVELVESVFPIDGGPAIEQGKTWIGQAIKARGVDLALSSQVGAFLRDAGLVDVTDREARLPVCSYGGKIGHLAAFDLLNAFRNIGTVLVGAGVMTQATLDAALKQADDDLHSDRYRCVWPVYAAYGRRTG